MSRHLPLPAQPPCRMLETRLLQEEPAKAGGTTEKDAVLAVGAISLVPAGDHAEGRLTFAAWAGRRHFTPRGLNSSCE